jgi:hypothetical protein
MAKKSNGQLSLKFNKRGENSKKASTLYRKRKKEWTRLFNEEVSKEKAKPKPNMPKAAKRASKRYKKFSWADAMRKV